MAQRLLSHPVRGRFHSQGQGGITANSGRDHHGGNATMLYLLGIDHKQLTFHYQGRDFRLTDTAGKVVQGVLA